MFSKLKLVYFFLVHYVTHRNGNEIVNSHETSRNQNVASETLHPPTALHCILRHSKHLEGIQATGTPYFGDGCLDNVLSRNPLKKLRRFILTDGSSTTDENAASMTTGKHKKYIITISGMITWYKIYCPKNVWRCKIKMQQHLQ